jgi:hypothetical protein
LKSIDGSHELDNNVMFNGAFDPIETFFKLDYFASLGYMTLSMKQKNLHTTHRLYADYQYENL